MGVEEEREDTMRVLMWVRCSLVIDCVDLM